MLKSTAFLPILCLTLICPLKTIAQTDDDFFNIGMQSPNAASLGEYGAIPVGKYTGIPSIKVPLYMVTIGELSVPIELSYHAGGIKADEIASWVGLGWSLNSGGVITRSMKGRPDEADQGYTDVSGKPIFLAHWSAPTEALRDSIIEHNWDTQPDEFFFNVGGQSGKFMFKSDGSVLQFPQSDFDISYANNTFTLIDGAGVKYTFSDTETTTQMGTIIGNPGTYTSSWFLSKIESPKGDHEINFNYSTTTTVLHQYAETQERRYPEDTGEVVCTDKGGQVTSANRVSTGNIYLASIVTDKETLTFHRSLRDDALHPDSPHAKQEYRLDSVSVTVNGSLLEKHLLTYGYYNGPGSTSSRLRLDSIHKEGADGSEAPPHTFEYNTNSLPIGTTFAVDHWGFFNGASTNLGNIPDYVGMGITYTSGADRDPNHNYNQSGILEKITYPSGGFTSLVYETNEYSKVGNTQLSTETVYTEQNETVSTGTSTVVVQSFTLDYAQRIILNYRFDNPSTGFTTAEIALLDSNDNTLFSDKPESPSDDQNQIREYELSSGTYKITAQGDQGQGVTSTNQVIYTDKTEQAVTNRKAGGLRVKQVTRNDGMSGSPDMVTNYKYHIKDSTGVSSGVIIAEPNYYGYTDDGGIQGICSYRFLSSTSFVPLSTTQGSFVGYRQVGEERSDGSGTTWSYFKAPDEVTDKSIGGGGWPHQTVSNDWKRGYLTKEEQYNESGNIQAVTINEYEIVNDTDVLKAIRYRIFEKPRQTSYGGGTRKFLRYEATSQSTAWLKQTRVKKRQYDETGTKFTQTSTSFGYDATATTLQPTTITEKNSDSTEVRVTRTRFAHQEETAMAGLNLLSQPYSVTIEDAAGDVLSKNWTVWSNTITGNNNWNVKKQWGWKGSGISDIDAAQDPDLEAEEVLEVLQYDTHGNPLETKDAAGIKTAYDWSADGTTLVGIFHNATKSQVFAHSFAYDWLTGWTIYDADGQDFDVSIDQGKLKLTNYASASNEELDRVHYDYGSEITGTVVVEFDVQMANSNNWDLIIAVGGNTWNYGNGGTETAVWSAINNESWRHYSGSWNTITSGLEIGKTYAFKMVLNTTLNRVDFYVDGKKWVSNASFRQSSTGIQKVVFGSYGYGTTTTDWYIDNVRMYPEGAQAQSQETDHVFGTPLAIKDASGSTNRFTYDSFGRLKEIYNANGERISRNVYYYSLDGNSSYTTTDPNRVETITYNDPADTTDKTLSLTYLDGLGRDIQSQVRGGTEAILTETRYNERGLPEVASRPIKKTGVSGYVANLMGATFAPDPAVQTTLPLPASSEVENYYDTVAPQDEEDFAYSYTQYEASPLARVEKSTLPGSAHKIGSGKEVETTYGLNTTETFTINGTTWGVNTLSKTVTQDPSGKETIVYTDGWGRTIVSGVNMNPGGDDILNKASSDLVTYFEYDLRGNLVRVEDPRGLATTYTYNQLGQLTSKKLPDQDYSVDYKYDEQGRLRFTQDPNQKSQKQDLSQSLSGNNTVTKQLIATSKGVLSYTIEIYDLFLDGYDVKIRHVENGNAIIHSNTRGSDGQLTGSIVVDPGTYVFYGNTQDPGEPIAGTYGTYSFASYDIYTYTKYDGLDRPTESGEYSGGTSFSAADPDADTFPTTGHTANLQYYYDGDQAASGATNLQGRLTKASYRDLSVATTSWGHTWYSYNTQGLVNSVEQDLPGLASKSIDYAYDELGRLTRQDYQAGQSDAFYQRYTYDPMGRLAKVETSTNGSSWIKDAEYTSYLADGNVGELKLGNSAVQTVDYTYTVQGWLDQVNGGVISGTDKFAMDLAYADNGNISSQQWRQSQISSGALATYTYSYDNANRLTAADFAGGTAYDVTYSYDKNGNLKGAARRNQSGSYAAAPFLMGIAAGSNRLTEIEDAVDVYTIGHDASGNMTSNPFNGLTSADYDWRNLPAQVIANSTTLQYAYDGDGNRVKKQVAGGTQTHYVRGAGGEVLATYVNGALEFHNILAGSEVIGTYDRTYRRYFLKDHLGSVRTTIHQNGDVVGYDDYYPFGLSMPNRNSKTAGNEHKYRFTGHERDTEASLTLDYMMARNYDPIIGRFLQIDPLFDQGGQNGWSPYHYTMNNPLNRIDPTGLLSTLVEENEDGTYTVVGGDANDGDTGIYVVTADGEKGRKIGESLTTHSFFDSNENPVLGAVIDLNSTEGAEFLDNLYEENPHFAMYGLNARNGEKYDFKDIGKENRGSATVQQHRYRGSVAGDGRIGSARDFGNIGAGLVTGRAGFSWEATRLLFDGYQGSKEPAVTVKAQMLGFGVGLDIKNIKTLFDLNK